MRKRYSVEQRVNNVLKARESRRNTKSYGNSMVVFNDPSLSEGYLKTLRSQGYEIVTAQ